jgi:hypothetical protein
VEDVIQHRACIECDHERAEMSILSDWVGAVPRFADKHFERTFRIKQHMMDTIITNLAHYNTFWIKTVCRADKESISLYVHFLFAQTMLCYGISASAFINYWHEAWISYLLYTYIR